VVIRVEIVVFSASKVTKVVTACWRS